MIKREYFLHDKKLNFNFFQNIEDFIVEEEPIEFSGFGNFLILKIVKQNCDTWELIDKVAKHLRVFSNEIGYAGLKDKNATTTQYISIPKKYQKDIKNYKSKKIEIFEIGLHNKKLNIGDLKGNRFKINLKDVELEELYTIDKVLKDISKFGMPNYFGFQRFGIDGENYKKGQAIVEGKLKERNRNLKQMFINAYQSYLFNSWLSKRIEISKLIETFEPKEIYEKLNLPLDEVKRAKKQPHPFKIITGDLLSHYPFGRIFIIDDLESESQKFFEKDRVPTGLLCGKRVKKSEGLAQEIEKEFDVQMGEDGARRFAFIFPENIQSNYKEDKNHMELNFYLPKGSYATEFIAEIIH